MLGDSCVYDPAVVPGGKKGRLWSGGDPTGLEHANIGDVTGAVRMVWVMLGIRGTVTSRARALYRRIWDVALKSPCGSAATIMTAF